LIQVLTGIVLGATSLLLFAFGLNLLHLTWRSTRLAAPPPARLVTRGEPAVCVQLPIYNERYVAERVLDAVCAIDWPRDRFEVQVLDDSDDATPSLVASLVARWKQAGVDARHVRRGSREGYKAGALAHGLTLTQAPFVAIFDADFVPPPDFLRRTMGAFDDASVGFVQARWGHLDERYSWFTRLQALAIDFHFLVEQPVRSAAGYFTNFTGTAGVWRRAAIEDAGGWSARTLTEDLDLSYRAQLRGWNAAYVEDLVVPEELPVSIDAYRRQQSRWATGSFQSAFRLLGPVLRSNKRPAVKIQAAAHLLAYGVGPVMLVQLACYPLLLVAFGAHGIHLPALILVTSVVAMFVGTAPWIGFVVAQTRRGRRWWAGLPAVLCQVFGAGMSLNTLVALLRATRPGGSFERTPKYRIERHDQEWRDRDYVKVGDPRALLEAAAGAAALALVPVAVAMGQLMVAVYAGMFATGFLVVAALSAADMLEVFTMRRLGRVALIRLRALAPAVGLLALAAGLLGLAAQVPEPFEDAYGHWLIAANLASTGHLRDPIFGMEDSWLPGYHVVAGAVLQLAGLWRLDLLKAMSALFGVATLALVYALAPSVRQGRLAIVLLALNPVFLFTSGSAVVEPMLTALLTGAALSAVRGRLRLASLLAALACLTSTKAWLWVGAAAAFAAVELLRGAGAGSNVPGVGRLLSRPTGALVWTAPAIALVAVLQLGFSPASHSVARGSVEVLSATARGSITGSAFSRLGELVATYGLGALPLLGFGAVGAVIAMRRQPVAMWRFLHVPALAYLAVVLTLVAEGAYTGSHRYLYPVLPSLALLAAAALDRYAGVVRVGAVAASGLLALAFFPVFVGFAAQNAGLVAAGRAASAAPGRLITDSPAVAFFSGKAPDDISGSQALPAERAAAMDWMAANGVSEIVVEDISYYRATALFPDLVTGRPAAPFSQLGSEPWYRVPGGKPLYAYRFGADATTQAVVPGIDVSLDSTGSGKTAMLARGLAIRTSAGNLAGEGMGFGTPIVQYRDGWVYARTATTEDLSADGATVWRRVFELNEMGGDAAHGYGFVPIASRGEVAVTYTIDSRGITVAVKPVWLAPGYSQVGILNEQSASFDDLAAGGQATVTGSRFGRWLPVAGAWARLRSGPLGVEWSVAQVPGAALFAGRELARPGFDWAGLDYMFGQGFAGTSYRINVQEAR